MTHAQNAEPQLRPSPGTCAHWSRSHAQTAPRRDHSHRARLPGAAVASRPTSGPSIAAGGHDSYPHDVGGCAQGSVSADEALLGGAKEGAGESEVRTRDGYFVGTSRFSSSSKCCTTTICTCSSRAASRVLLLLIIRERGATTRAGAARGERLPTRSSVHRRRASRRRRPESSSSVSPIAGATSAGRH